LTLGTAVLQQQQQYSGRDFTFAQKSSLVVVVVVVVDGKEFQ